MRVLVVCVALCCWAPVAVAQVSFVRRDAADDKVAAALEQLLGEKVVMLAAANGGDDGPVGPMAARVSIDRKAAVLHVVSPANPVGLTRALDSALLIRAPYAVALAAAELLDLLQVTSQSRPRESPGRSQIAAVATRGAEVSGSANTEAPRRASASSEAASTAAPELAPAEEAADASASGASAAGQIESSTGDSGRAHDPDRASSESPASLVRREPETTELMDSSSAAEMVQGGEGAAPAGLGPAHAARRSGPPNYAFGIDLELQSQPKHALSFLRPALYGEFAWGRENSGAFWSAGARVCAPFSTELQPLAAGTAEDSRVRARAMDAALLGSLGYSIGGLGLAAHVAVGASYLRVEALDSARHPLGDNTQFLPLLAVGVGVRLPIALGFGLSLQGEAQWAGPGTEYEIGGDRALIGGPFRLGALAGILWESALGS